MDAARDGMGFSADGWPEGVHYNRRAGSNPVIEDHEGRSADPERIPQLLAEWANRDRCLLTASAVGAA